MWLCSFIVVLQKVQVWALARKMVVTCSIIVTCFRCQTLKKRKEQIENSVKNWIP